MLQYHFIILPIYQCLLTKLVVKVKMFKLIYFVLHKCFNKIIQARLHKYFLIFPNRYL